MFFLTIERISGFHYRQITFDFFCSEDWLSVWCTWFLSAFYVPFSLVLSPSCGLQLSFLSGWTIDRMTGSCSLSYVTYPVITFATDFATPRRIPLAKSTVCRCHMVQPKAKKAHIELFCTHTIKHFKTLFNSTERRSLIWLVRILAPKPRPFQHDKKISIAGGVVHTNN